jgi:pyruvate-formate lyase-activating enzyme
MKLKCNCCDGIYNSFDVHFTSACDNKCAHCVDTCYAGKNIIKPDYVAIADTIIANKEGLDDVLFLGGEPCLFLEELIKCVDILREKTDLKLYVTTSVPKVCYDKKDLFFELIDKLDGMNLSVQHYREDVADEIRKTKSAYNRQKFYKSLPHKEKIRINLNIVKPYLYEKDDIIECLKYYDQIGFNSIKLSEIQHGAEYYVSFEKVFDINLGSPYSEGCQKYIDMDKIIPGFKTPMLLKRSCFACEDTLKATVPDVLKTFCKLFEKQSNKYGVVYEDGSLEQGWV